MGVEGYPPFPRSMLRIRRKWNVLISEVPKIETYIHLSLPTFEKESVVPDGCSNGRPLGYCSFWKKAYKSKLMSFGGCKCGCDFSTGSGPNIMKVLAIDRMDSAIWGNWSRHF